MSCDRGRLQLVGDRREQRHFPCEIAYHGIYEVGTNLAEDLGIEHLVVYQGHLKGYRECGGEED